MINPREPDVRQVDVLPREKVITDADRPFARAVRRRPEVEHVFRDRVDAVGRYAIAGKRVTNHLACVVRVGTCGEVIIDHNLTAGWIESSGEIPGLLIRGGNRRQELIRSARPNTLVVCEEECPVSKDASTHRST